MKVGKAAELSLMPTKRTLLSLNLYNPTGLIGGIQLARIRFGASLLGRTTLTSHFSPASGMFLVHFGRTPGQDSLPVNPV
jgi:hypothetical protein